MLSHIRQVVFVSVFMISSLWATPSEFLISQNTFGLNIFKKMGSDIDNVIISPIGIRAVLLMLAKGADGNTKLEILKALNTDEDKVDDLIIEHKNLFDIKEDGSINRPCGIVKENGILLPQVKEAYSFWIQQEFPIKQNYLNILKNGFSAHLEVLDFNKAKTQATKRINDWTYAESDSLINNAVKESDIPDSSVFVAENIITFQSEWAELFDRSATETRKFNGVDGNSKKVKFMKKKTYFGYHETHRFSALRLNYKCSYFSFFLIMPKSDKISTSILNELNGKVLNQIQADLEMKYLDLSIPKFEFESKVKLKEILMDFGIDDLFNIFAANLVGISDIKPLFISNFFQNVIIKVNEEKTVAAAATFAVGGCGAGDPPHPKKVIIDRPFYYFIIHNKTGTVLFAGSVVKFDDKMKQEK